MRMLYREVAFVKSQFSVSTETERKNLRKNSERRRKRRPRIFSLTLKVVEEPYDSKRESTRRPVGQTHSRNKIATR